MVEGPRTVFDLLSNPSTQELVRNIFVSAEDYEQDYQNRLSLSHTAKLQLVAPDVMKALSDTVTPQGKLRCIFEYMLHEF